MNQALTQLVNNDLLKTNPECLKDFVEKLVAGTHRPVVPQESPIVEQPPNKGTTTTTKRGIGELDGTLADPVNTESYKMFWSKFKRPMASVQPAETTPALAPVPSPQEKPAGEAVAPTPVPSPQEKPAGEAVAPTPVPSPQEKPAGEAVAPTPVPSPQEKPAGEPVAPTPVPSPQEPQEKPADEAVAPTPTPSPQEKPAGEPVAPTPEPSPQEKPAGEPVAPTATPSPQEKPAGEPVAPTPEPSPQEKPAGEPVAPTPTPSPQEKPADEPVAPTPEPSPQEKPAGEAVAPTPTPSPQEKPAGEPGATATEPDGFVDELTAMLGQESAPHTKQHMFAPAAQHVTAALMRKTTVDLADGVPPQTNTLAPKNLPGHTSVRMIVGGVEQHVWVPMPTAEAIRCGLQLSSSDAPSPPSAAPSPPSAAPPPPSAAPAAVDAEAPAEECPPEEATVVEVKVGDDGGKAVKNAYMRFHRSISSALDCIYRKHIYIYKFIYLYI